MSSHISSCRMLKSSTVLTIFCSYKSVPVRKCWLADGVEFHFSFVLSPIFCCCSPPHSPVEAVGTEAMSTLGLKWSSEYIVAAVAQVLVLQLITQDLLGEAGFIALHGRRRGRFLCGHGVCSHVTPGKGTICQDSKTRQRNVCTLMQQKSQRINFVYVSQERLTNIHN